MHSTFRYLWVLLAFLFLRVRADCSSYGVDYTNGGSYYVDGSSNQYFSFITVFQGCSSEAIQPILVDPDGNEYACSAVNTTPAGSQVTSTCGIPFSAMKSGKWKIVVSGDQIAVQRTITLTVGVPQTVVVTATPTIVIGITSTPRAQTVVNTVQQTQTLILVPATVTAGCNGGTRTVTAYPNNPTVTVTSTIVRTATDGQVTSLWTTTVASTAICHYPSSGSSPQTTSLDNRPSPVSSGGCASQTCYPYWQGGKGGKGGGWGWRGKGKGSNAVGAAEKRDVAATAVVAAVTSTYTETTYTVTRTLVTTIPAKTTTEVVFKTITATITPAASTICANGGAASTVTVRGGNGATATLTNVIYATTHLSGTVWVGQTQYTTYTNAASATACWRAGGWFGI